MNRPTDDLAAAVDALGAIMLAMQGRRLLARGVRNFVIRAKLEADALTDEQIGNLAAKAFESGALALAEAGHPGSTAFTCNPKETDRG